MAAGLLGQDTDWSRVASSDSPTLAACGVYADLYGWFRQLYPATAETVHALARFARERGLQQGGGSAR